MADDKTTINILPSLGTQLREKSLTASVSQVFQLIIAPKGVSAMGATVASVYTPKFASSRLQRLPQDASILSVYQLKVDAP